MQVSFSGTAKEQLAVIKSYIAKDNPGRAVKHIKKLIDRIKRILEFPYIGRMNTVYNREDIREIVIEGYKVIYQIRAESIIVLVVLHDASLTRKRVKLNKSF
ncbi:MAG: type II toxin-antitoxin system RelE/ParE family toxin, partial [Candidatus Aminicenantes bacterium]|nr:type II toxin-antitoxin system RelE/ParE family toxin [Candidatus Aminicenantes bacterium]